MKGKVIHLKNINRKPRPSKRLQEKAQSFENIHSVHEQASEINIAICLVPHGSWRGIFCLAHDQWNGAILLTHTAIAVRVPYKENGVPYRHQYLQQLDLFLFSALSRVTR